MKHLRLLAMTAVALALPSMAAAQAAPAAAESDPAIDLYVAKCASCHTVGKGDRVGPDLAGVHTRRDAAWLAQMVQAPSKLLDRDATARQLLQKYNNVRMPDLGLSDEDVATLVALIARCSDEPCELVGKFTPVTDATAADVARGRALFTGELPSESGAAPCMACHTVSSVGGVPGGTLSVDLTHAFARLGDEGLDAALKNPAFAVMNKVFSDRPLDEAEVFALRAFLDDANRSDVKASPGWPLLLVGVLGAVAILAALNAFWRRRLLGVRATIRGREASA